MANIIKIHDKKLSKLQIGIIIAITAIILVSVFFIYKYQTTTKTVDKKNTISKSAKKLLDRSVKVDEAVADGGYDDGQEVLDEALKSAATNSERSEIYVQKASLALNSSKSDQAIEFANAAEKANPSRLTATMLAIIAEQVGDKTLSLKYYRLVVERTTEQEKKLAPDEYEYYQAKVAELSK